MSHPVFVVLGATGAQGGSVVNAILKFNHDHPDKAFKVRGVARTIEGPAATALHAKGVELVQGNMTNPEDLKKAFVGASHLFAVTQVWDKESAGREYEIGKHIGDQAKAAGIKYVWWSELANAEKLSGGKYHVHHFTDKAKIGDYMRSLGLKVIAVGPAFYFSNWIHAFSPSKADDGALEWKVPLSPKAIVTAFEVTDTGIVVGATLEHPDQYVGKFIPIAGSHKTVQEYIDDIGKAAGIKTRVVSIPRDVFATFFPGAAELADMCGWFEDFHYFGPGADLELAKKLTHDKITSWDTWLAHNAEQFKKRAQ